MSSGESQILSDGLNDSNLELPRQIIITGGREVGGLASFADALYVGFQAIGIPTHVLPPSKIFTMGGSLRNPQILKILSTTAVFAVPHARRAICMAHGIPRVDAQGWKRLMAVIASFKIANRCSGAQLVSVSHFTATTLRTLFAVRTDAVIHNPIKPLYAEPLPSDLQPRTLITYAGRLDVAKNVHRIVPAMKTLLDQTVGLTACIIGDGRERVRLQATVAGDPRFEFKTSADDLCVRDCLRRTRVFLSGNEVEGFGIAYLEAMTQGCIVAMPAGGGGIEINPGQIGRAVKLLPLSWNHNEMVAVLKAALQETWTPVQTERFTLETAVQSYLQVDGRFSRTGKYAPIHSETIEC